MHTRVLPPSPVSAAPAAFLKLSGNLREGD